MSHGGGGGGVKGVIAILAVIVLIIVVMLMFALLPPLSGSSKLNPFKSNSSSSTQSGGGSKSGTVFQPDKRISSGGTWPQGTGVKSGTTGTSGAYSPYHSYPVSSSTSNYYGGGSGGTGEQPLPAGFTKGQISPQYKKIRLSSVYLAGSAWSGQISLSASLQGSERVDVTGWQIKGNRGAYFIPKAVDNYSPSGLTAETDIMMRGSDTLYLYMSGSSGVGKNVRLNKCFGYLPSLKYFDPAVPASCPYIDRSELKNFTGQCQNYVLSLGSCAMPDFSDPRIPRPDEACRTFLTTLNYSGCYERHSGDADFLKNDIRAWIGSGFLDPFHDRVLLLDRNGLLVDMYEY